MLFLVEFCVFVMCLTSVLSKELLIDYLSLSKSVNITTACAKDLDLIRKGIDEHEIWAMKIRDASGKSTSNFVWGNNFWLGNKLACEMLNNPKLIPLTDTKTRRHHENITAIASKIPVVYRMIYASHTSPIQFDIESFEFVGLQIGICFPKACVDEDTIKMSHEIFSSGEFQDTQIYGEVKFAKTKVLKLRENFFDDFFVKSFA